MKDDRREHHILWYCPQLASSEHASLADREDGHQLTGVVVVPLDGVPSHISYEVIVDRHWFPLAGTTTVMTPERVSTIGLTLEGSARWKLGGRPAPHLDGCEDIDLGWTPATNTIPIRRLTLQVGETRTIRAAWVRFPELDVVASEQRYTRLADDRWRYRSGDYNFELLTDPSTGLVLAYGDDLWHAAAMAPGPSSR